MRTRGCEESLTLSSVVQAEAEVVSRLAGIVLLHGRESSLRKAFLPLSIPASANAFPLTAPLDDRLEGGLT